MEIRQDLVRHYQWLRRYGLNDAHSGNASARDGKRLWITPTGACADTLTAEELIACPADGPAAKGASLDTPLHQAVYRARARTAAVLHSHAPHLTALTMNGEDFVPDDFEGRFYFDRVPVVNVPFERHLDEAPQRVAELLARHRIAVVRGHGVYAAGDSLNLAYKWICSAELSARTAFLARQWEAPYRG